MAWNELESFVSTNLDEALRVAGIGTWGWDPRTDECVWSLPGPGSGHGSFDDFVMTAIPEDREGFAVALRHQRARGGAVHHTFRQLRDEGPIGRVQLDGMVVQGPDDVEVVVGVARDDTKQMVLDDRLAASFALRDRVARALETSLLPPALPEVAGFAVDADFRSSEGSSTGDFYDLFALADDDWGLTIGDVGGHGTEAAAVTSAIRYTLRAAAQVRKSPTRVMAAANEAHFAAVRDERFTTAHYIRIQPRAGGVQLRVATAGHPELLIRRSSGRIEALSGVGPMLGLVRSASFVEARARLEPGDVVIAYTDGVTEARREGLHYGREELETFLGSWIGEIHGCAAALHDAVAEFTGGHPRDDMATVIPQRT